MQFDILKYKVFSGWRDELIPMLRASANKQSSFGKRALPSPQFVDDSGGRCRGQLKDIAAPSAKGLDGNG